MSSFEPLFRTANLTRFTQPDATAAAATDTWIPIPVTEHVPRAKVVFEAFHPARPAVSDVTQRAAADAAAAHAHQAQLDAAFARGVSHGLEQGEKAERARLRGAMLAAETALDDLRAGESRWLNNIEENISAIAIAVAHQIVAREVSIGNDIVLDITTRAVQEFGLDQALTIRINPGDLESLQSADRAASEEMVSMTKGREVRWVSDARIEPGGCVVEGRERIVDGRVDTGLERLYRRLAHANA